jgi:hypothetical protein
MKYTVQIRDSAVGIATSYELDHQEGRSSSSDRVKNFLFSRPALGSTQPPIQWVPGAERPGRETDHSLPNCAQVRKCGSINPLPHRLHGIMLN